MKLMRFFLTGILAAGSLTLIFPVLAEGENSAESQTGSTDEISVEDYFRAGTITNATLSPDGSKVAYTEYQKILVGSPPSDFSQIAKYRSSYAIQNLQWSGNNVLIVESIYTESGEQVFEAFEIVPDGEGYKQGRNNDFRKPGYLLDPLIDEPDYIIFARSLFEKKSSYANVFRVNLFEGINSQTHPRNRLNKYMDEAEFYVLDQNNEPVVGLGYKDESPHLFVRNDKGDWDAIWSGVANSKFIPRELSADGLVLWALSDATTDRLAAVEFNISTAKITRILFEHDTNDLIDIVFSGDRIRPIGVSFLEAGHKQYKFFEASDDAGLSRLQRLLPGRTIHVAGATQNRETLLAVTSSTQDPLAYHLCRLTDDQCTQFGSVTPWLNETGLAETQTLNTPSSDGFEVRAFLTLPDDSNGTVPLIVMPHGGPIDVQDTAYFSADVQWLAKNGYAVLQVNFRGSSGYGKRFKSAGLRQWGRGIEDDIEASLANALASYPVLDKNRIGIYGASYGGYSALQSIVRNAETYQCAASFAGVTDLTLLFDRPDIRRNEKLHDALVEIVGDPSFDKQELLQYSPVYNYRKISKPVFIAHGTADSVVDIEHSWRLKKMLDLAGATVDFHILNDIGHGFEKTTEARALYDPLIEFLDRHLK